MQNTGIKNGNIEGSWRKYEIVSKNKDLFQNKKEFSVFQKEKKTKQNMRAFSKLQLFWFSCDFCF